MSPSTLPLCYMLYIDQTAAPSPAAAAHPSTGTTHRTVGHKNQLVTLLNSYFQYFHINLNVTQHYLHVTLSTCDTDDLGPHLFVAQRNETHHQGAPC